MVNKLVENVDNKVWLEFTSKCRADGVLVGHRLTDILKEHLNGSFSEVKK